MSRVVRQHHLHTSDRLLAIGSGGPVNRNAYRIIPLAMALTAGAGLPALRAQTRDSVPTVTLEEARRRAVAADPASVTARTEVGAAAWERRAARLDLFTPNVAVGTSYVHYSEPFFNLGTGGISPNATSATVEARYTLVGGGKLAALKRSGASLASAQANETTAQFRSAFAADAAYYAVLADRELSRVAADRLRRATEQFGIARVRVRAGDAIAPDSLQLLLEMNRARLEVLRQDSALQVARLALGRKIGVGGPVDAAPVDTTPPSALPVSLEQAVTELRARGPEVLSARAAEGRASAVLNAARESYLPAITVGATTGAYDSKLFPSGVNRSQVSVGVTWPLWNAGEREVAVARAGAQADAARAVRLDAERAAAERMAAAYHGHETARAGIELAQTGVTLATETYRVQSARYREGATTILDLLEAQVALSEAEVTLIQARYAARLALAEVETLLGRRIDE
jgi:outer membrane protein